MPRMYEPLIELNYKVTGNTRVILIVEHEDDRIKWVCSTSIYTDYIEPETLNEVMTRPNGHLWEISAISDVNNFLSRKAWILTKRSVIKAKVIKTAPIKWIFNSKEDPDGLFCLSLKILVQGYIEVPGVDFTDSFLSVASNTRRSILIGLNLYHKEDLWVAGICDVEATLLHPNLEVEMCIEWPEVIVDLGIITK